MHKVLLILISGVALLATRAVAQVAPQPTCEQRLAATYGQYQQSIAINTDREAMLRKDYEDRLVLLHQQVKQLQQAAKPPEKKSEDK